VLSRIQNKALKIVCAHYKTSPLLHHNNDAFVLCVSTLNGKNLCVTFRVAGKTQKVARTYRGQVGDKLETSRACRELTSDVLSVF
jgi:hypothetical protein